MFRVEVYARLVFAELVACDECACFFDEDCAEDVCCSVHAHEYVTFVPVECARDNVALFEHVFRLDLVADDVVELAGKNYFYFTFISGA